MIKVSKKAVIVDFSGIVSFENDFKCCGKKTHLERSLWIFFRAAKITDSTSLLHMASARQKWVRFCKLNLKIMLTLQCS